MVDKMKEWKKNGDKESIKEYNKWKNTNYKIKYGLIKDEKLLTTEQKEKKKTCNEWYLKNREKILKDYHAKKPYVWVYVNIEDRDFCLNFNPKEYPKYLEEIKKKKLEFNLN